MTFKVKVYGARGSVPVSGPDTEIFGGNTPCVLAQVDDHVIVFDAGSGIIQLGKDLREQGFKEIDLFLSHPHYDHIIGLPFFEKFKDKEAHVRIWSAGSEAIPDTRTMLDEYMRAPFFPVTLSAFPAKIEERTIQNGDKIGLHTGIIVKTIELNHPGKATGYRVEYGGHSFCYISDFEHDDGIMDLNLTRFIEGADLAVLDATYTSDEYQFTKGFGHSTWQACGKICEKAGVKEWRLFHHEHSKTDETLLAIERDVQNEYPNASLAREGETIELGHH